MEIFVDKKINTCFTTRGIQMLYILDGKEIPLKLGSNNLTQENIKDKKNINFKIENEGKIKEFRRPNTEICSGQSSELLKTKWAGTFAAIATLLYSIKSSYYI